jgi:DNA mismatch repair ATPase MutS
VANDVDADERALIVITGANQGGKSTFLRSVGVAQLFMQCGLFVTAETFSADLCSGVFTHYKRAEDAALVSGKFDEELARMEDITQSIQPHALLLLNESFAATSAREGSEIARQVTQALIEAHVRVVFVTHLYDFAHTVFERSPDDVLFLRAERRADRQRTFKVVQGEPLQTSFGADVYDEVFGADAPAPAVAARS